MTFLRKLIGAAPTPTEDGAFAPSPLALKLATSPTTDYDGGAYPQTYAGDNPDGWLYAGPYAVEIW